jgi:acyl-CoA thioesterase FadM
MLSLKAHIGKSSKWYQDVVSSQRISDFCTAIKCNDLSLSPATFMTCFRQGELEHVKTFGIDLTRLLHTEQEFDYHSPIRAGDRIQYRTHIKKVLEKLTPSQHVQFVTFETEVHGERNSMTFLVGKTRSTIVIREKG